MYVARGRASGLVSIVACAVLAGWIVVLLSYPAPFLPCPALEGAWVGFDLIRSPRSPRRAGRFCARPQIVIAFLMSRARCCAVTPVRHLPRPGLVGHLGHQVATAVVADLPMAFLMFNAARRADRAARLVAMSDVRGTDGPADAQPLRRSGRSPCSAWTGTPPEAGSLTRITRTRSGEYHSAPT